jgi:sugar phosphate isomerase/epimerase
MIRFAVSNIGLPAFTHSPLLPRLAEMGATGLEVAPSRVWADTWHGLTARQVDEYRRTVETAGLRVVGLHSLFFDHPALGLFKPELRAETVDFLVHLSGLCRDLGGRTLVYGGGRRRGELEPQAAMAECRSFLGELLPRMEDHGTRLCFEPLGPKDTDFLNTAGQCLELVEMLAHPALGVQLDAKALVDNGEVGPEPFERVRGRLDHFHANDPGLVVVGSTGLVDHAALGGHLRAIGYDGFVAVEQRMLNEADPLADTASSLACLAACYGGVP